MRGDCFAIRIPAFAGIRQFCPMYSHNKSHLPRVEGQGEGQLVDIFPSPWPYPRGRESKSELIGISLVYYLGSIGHRNIINAVVMKR